MTVRDYLSGIILDAWKPRPTARIAEWAREKITLAPAENRKFSGQGYDVERTPHVEAFFDFIQGNDPTRRIQPIDHGTFPPHQWRELVIIKSSQSGLTLAHFIAIGWIIEHRPGNILYITNTRDNTRELSKRRLEPILHSIGGEIADRLTDSDQTVLTKEINGVLLRLAGGQAASDLITWPISYVMLDEAEIHDLLPEGSTIELCVARVKADDESKVSIFTKPQDAPEYTRDPDTNKPRLTTGRGTLAYDRFLSGTQEKLHVPCPHCGHYQELIWDQVRYEVARTSLPGVLPVEYDLQRVLRETTYECELCHRQISEDAKPGMMTHRRIVPTPMEKRQRRDIYPRPVPGRRSLHISDLYVHGFAAVTWGALAVKWLEGQGDDEKLKAFYNDHLGLPRPVRRARAIAAAHIQRLQGAYRRLRLFDSRGALVGAREPLPCQPYMIGILADYQAATFKWILTAYTSTLPELRDNGEIWVLDWGAIANVDWDLLQEVADTPVTAPDGTKFAAWRGLIDARYRPKDVYRFCWENPRTFRPAMGYAETASKGFVWPRPVEWEPGRQIEVCSFDAQHWEGELYSHRIQRYDPKEYAKHRTHRHPRIHLPEDIDDQFVAEITNMREVQVQTRSGFPRYEWQKINQHQPNDWGDCLKLAPILWILEGRPNIAAPAAAPSAA